ncbi:hypothetical protein Nepgr_005712 [Nepenthes gracilis]|uniref:Pentatricopeptide repeat-containing protein n=1 Tax=Nepenthes gracilis TaxID=150966 RepID=A0AAD3S3T8_NEPGR|nr:hypothetical protein Nepgr_005712 [Nepenthes gracilis]
MVNVAARLAGRFKSVNGIVRELESIGCVTRVQTFLLFLRIFWHGSMYDMVFEAFEEMMRFGYMPNTFAHNVIIDVSFRIQRADLGLTILRNMPAPNFLSFNIALCNLCKLNDLNSIGVVIRSMMKTGYYPNVETLVMVLNCFSKKGRMAQAFQLVGLMVSLGNQVSVVVWSILIDGLCKRGRHVLAIYLLEKMIDTGCSPNVVTYTSLVKGLMESEMINDALRILNLMESRGCEVDLVLCNMLIDCFSKIGRYDEALGVFFGLRKHNIYPDSYTYSSLFSTLRLSGKFHLLPKVAGGSVIPADLVVCNSLISYFCKAGLATHAVKFYDSMLEKGFTPDKYTFAGLLNALCRAKIIDEAIKVYHGITMNHFDLDAHVHTMIIGGLIKAGKHHRAIHLFREAVTAKYPLDVVSYTVAIHGLVTGSRVEEAYNLYNQMKEGLYWILELVSEGPLGYSCCSWLNAEIHVLKKSYIVLAVDIGISMLLSWRRWSILKGLMQFSWDVPLISF